MDANWKLYEDKPENIPTEDKLRLEAYLRGREDADREGKLEQLRARLERLEQGS